MTERLDKIEAQQKVNTDNIANLIAMSTNLLRAVEGLSERSLESGRRIEESNRRIEENNQRFEILRQEAAEDRRRSDERFDRMLLEIRRLSDRNRPQSEADNKVD